MEKRYSVLSAAFCVCLVASNIFEAKIFTLGPLTLTGGFLVFPISYIINDCITELYGYKASRTVIFTAFVLNVAFLAVSQLLLLLPSASFWDGQTHFEYFFKSDLRISLASMAAFLTGSLVNARIMDKMRSGRHFCVRAIFSTLCGESADSLVFFPIAFWSVGVKNMLLLMLTQIVLKTAYEIIVLPLTAAYVRKVRKSGCNPSIS